MNRLFLVLGIVGWCWLSMGLGARVCISGHDVSFLTDNECASLSRRASDG